MFYIIEGKDGEYIDTVEFATDEDLLKYSKDNPDHILEEFVDPNDYLVDDDYFEGIDDDEDFKDLGFTSILSF